MERTTASTEWRMIALLAIPFVFLLMIWPQLPDTLPGHYHWNGQPDRYDSKGTLATALIATTALLYAAFRFAPRVGPRMALQTALYQKIRWLIMLFWTAFLIGFWVISWQGVQPQTFSRTWLIGLVLLIADLGNLLNSVRPNYVVGIRTPWTLASEQVWRRTHRLAGRLLMLGGLTSIVLVLRLPAADGLVFFVGMLALMILSLVVYSYVYFRQENLRQHD